jgi:glycosyltransferase involved in cell wall biosynthesis
VSSIVILSGNHLCHNPRVLKEATTLAGVGHRVTVLGAWHDAELKARDLALIDGAQFEFIPAVDLTCRKPAAYLERLRGKTARLIFRYARRTSRWQLGIGVDGMLEQACRLPGDLFIAHSEPALLVARHLATSGRRVGIDLEDWFSEDLPPEVRKRRPIGLLRELECTLLSAGAYSSCPSEAMSRALATEFRCRPPSVVYNTFPWADRGALDGLVKDRRDLNLPSIHWYSQTIGFGRGLEALFSALPLLKCPVEVHLRGRLQEGFAARIDSQIPPDVRSRVYLHDFVENDELLSRIAEHDIGFAGEVTECRSRDVTITNKILHYLLGGLAVIASDTIGQREVAMQSDGSIALFPSGDVRALGAELNRLLLSRVELERLKRASLHAAETTFCWERCRPRLLRAVEEALLWRN